jgi:hypothetical protein
MQANPRRLPHKRFEVYCDGMTEYWICDTARTAFRIVAYLTLLDCKVSGVFDTLEGKYLRLPF